MSAQDFVRGMTETASEGRLPIKTYKITSDDGIDWKFDPSYWRFYYQAVLERPFHLELPSTVGAPGFVRPEHVDRVISNDHSSVVLKQDANGNIRTHLFETEADRQAVLAAFPHGVIPAL